MPSAVRLRVDYSAKELRMLAKRLKDNNQARRLLSLAAVLDGMNREDAARIGGMDRQTATGSPTASSKPVTTSSRLPVMLGATSSSNPQQSLQSDCETGLTSVNLRDRWYKSITSVGRLRIPSFKTRCWHTRRAPSLPRIFSRS